MRQLLNVRWRLAPGATGAGPGAAKAGAEAEAAEAEAEGAEAAEAAVDGLGSGATQMGPRS